MMSPWYATIPTDADAGLVRQRHPVIRIMHIRQWQKNFMDRNYEYGALTSWIFAWLDYFPNFPNTCFLVEQVSGGLRNLGFIPHKPEYKEYRHSQKMVPQRSGCSF
jgi:hypothetical protein